MKYLMICALLVLPAAPVLAQEGPHVPCVECENLTMAPYPEPGHWYNPEQSGTGFNLEFQDGVLAGYYYGYAEDGEPEWYLVTKQLLRSSSAGVMWEATVEPQRFSGGKCMGCPYVEPADPESLPEIKLEFLQRAHARVTFGDGSVEYMVPLTYGDPTKAVFSDKTSYRFPMISNPPPYPSLWSLVIRTPDEDYAEGAPWTWVSGIIMIREGRVPGGGSKAGKLVYTVNQPAFPPEGAAPFGEIVCELHETVDEPVCKLTASALDPVEKPEFIISVGNFTDSRIHGESEDGRVLQAFRLQYD